MSMVIIKLYATKPFFRDSDGATESLMIFSSKIISISLIFKRQTISSMLYVEL